MKYIVITGTPSDGFRYTGPFDNEEDAINYIEYSKFDWWIDEIKEPEVE